MTELEKLVEERQRLKGEIEVAQKRIDDDLDTSILLELTIAGELSTEVEVSGKKWSVYASKHGGQEILNRMKLVEAGVTSEQLAKGTTTAKSSIGVTVKEKGSKEGKTK